MKRRAFLSAIAGAALPLPVLAADTRTLRYVPTTPLVVLDPVFSTANGTVAHGYYVFDTLYAVDHNFIPHPQMAEGHAVSDDGLTWTIRLRDGLRFHDSEAVRSIDCIASLQRWCSRDAFGQVLARAVAEWQAPDDRTIRLRLRERFPLLPDVLAKPTGPAFIMPERLARTASTVAIKDMVGSGPFQFVADEYVSGTRAVYRRFAQYVPREEPSDWASGKKLACVERIEWTTIPDAATTAAALQTGDVDWWETVPPDLVQMLAKHPQVRVAMTDPTGYLPILRFNTLLPPFDNAAIRRAVLRSVHQSDYLALLGDPDDPNSTQACHSFFPCGTPYGVASSPDPLEGPVSAEEGRRLLAQAGYKGERVVILNPSDQPTIATLGEMTFDLLKRLGMNAELATSDWATVVQRRASKGPIEHGGWNIFHTWNTGASMSNPMQNSPLRGLGQAGWFGWYASQRMEELASAWLHADTHAERLAIGARMQVLGLDDAPTIPLGQFFLKTAYRSQITGIRPAPVPFPWGVGRE